MIRAVLVAVLAAVLLATAAHAEQCGCPAPWEPPTPISPLPVLQPWAPQVWLPQVAGGNHAD